MLEYLELLQESIRIQRESEAPSRDGPPSDRHHAMIGRWGKRRRAAELWKSKSEKEEDKPAPQDGELWTFLIGHIAPILSGKGHNDQQPNTHRSQGSTNYNQSNQFPGPSCPVWSVDGVVRRSLIEGENKRLKSEVISSRFRVKHFSTQLIFFIDFCFSINFRKWTNHKSPLMQRINSI